MRNTKSVAFPHASLACTRTHASRVAHLAVKDKGSTVVFPCGSGMERKKEGAAVGGSGGGGVGGRSRSSATQTDHSGKNASLVLVC